MFSLNIQQFFSECNSKNEKICIKNNFSILYMNKYKIILHNIQYKCIIMHKEKEVFRGGFDMIRSMTIEDYEEVHALWMSIKGFAIRSVDDSKEGVAVFLKRNPKTSVVAVEDGKVVGAILCGHDGRRGCLYHVCVAPDYRLRGIGKEMVVFAMKRLQEEHINKVALIAFTSNDIGNAFWNEIGWTEREDLNYYDFTLNDANIVAFNE